MARTIVGVFDEREQAQRVVEDLVESGFRRDDISLMMRDTRAERPERQGRGSHAAEGAGAGAGIGAILGGAGGLLVGLGALAIPGIGPLVAAGPLAAALAGAGIGAGVGALVGALVGMGIPEQEAEYYSEAVRRGGTLVAVKSTDDMADRAASIMERHNPVDVARRAAEWRAEGWVPTTTREHVTAEERPATEGHRTGERPMMEGRRTDDTHFEEVQEELKVGKREVDAGGERVERRVVEEPAEEDVTLRQERVNVERRPVDRPASGEDLEAFKEGSVEFRERHEEPVVQKEARVTEEIDVGKTVEERTETIRDTLRRVEVDVESLGHEGDRGFDAMDSSFRRHYDMSLGDSGYGYDYYRPAYQYGYDLARSGRYREYDWNGIESQARQQWEARNPNTWDRVRDAIRQGWQESREGTIQRQY